MRFSPICRGEVDHDDPTVVFAVKSQANAFTGERKPNVGAGDYLHKRCYHEAEPTYQLKPKPN